MAKTEAKKKVPMGSNNVTPHIVCSPCVEAIEFYKKAFGAEELGTFMMPDGSKVMHAAMKIGNSVVFLVDEFPEWGSVGPKSLGGSPVTLHIQVDDADSFVQRATDAGLETIMPLEDMFWGDRYGKFKDPFGHEWSVATHIRDVSPEEMEKAAREMFSQMEK